MTPDISAYAQYEWHELVWYVDNLVDTAASRRNLGHWLGVTEDQGTSMTNVILLKSCVPIVRTSVFPVSENWRLNPKYHAELKELVARIQGKAINYLMTKLKKCFQACHLFPMTW
jgi:hypothetical protein